MEIFLWFMGVFAFLGAGLIFLAVIGIVFGKKEKINTQIIQTEELEVFFEPEIDPRVNFYASVNRIFYIEYVDSQGELTERKIKANWIETNSSGELVLRAFCYLRNQKRSFRIDKIMKMFDGHKRPILEKPEDYFKMFKEDVA